MRKKVVDKRIRFTAKDRFKKALTSTLSVEKRVSDQQPSSLIKGIDATVELLLDIHNADLREFMEDVQDLVPQDKQGQLEKFIKFYLG